MQAYCLISISRQNEKMIDRKKKQNQKTDETKRIKVGAAEQQQVIVRAKNWFQLQLLL